MRQRFLLHVCCGPCSIVIFDELLEQFDMTVHFYNPNIHPKGEYDKRKNEVLKICKNLSVPVIEGAYDSERWFQLTAEHKNEPEGGARCPICFTIRLEHAAEYARDNNFDYFSTSLTMGRNKKADVINPIGIDLGKKYGVEFFEADWKKGGRQEKAARLVKEHDIYRQEYCGCVYSRDKRQVTSNTRHVPCNK